jgi:hypothetical protein
VKNAIQTARPAMARDQINAFLVFRVKLESFKMDFAIVKEGFTKTNNSNALSALNYA